MIYTHPLKEEKMNLSSCTTRHSGDETYVYKTVNGAPSCLSVFYPGNFNQKNKYPTIFFIHGGGWTNHKIFEDQSGWNGDYLGYLARYYAEKGFVTVSIDYRLSSPDGQAKNHQIIDCYDDCADAADYLLDHASEYGIDTELVYILGESAGGHLAGLMATKYERAGFRFKRAFLVNAITDVYGDSLWNGRVPNASTHPELKALPQSEWAKYLSPLYHIGQDTCPVVLIHGLEDACVNPRHSESFYERMKAFGRECELHWIEDTNHAFLLTEYNSNDKYAYACKMGIEILNIYLHV